MEKISFLKLALTFLFLTISRPTYNFFSNLLSCIQLESESDSDSNYDENQIQDAKDSCTIYQAYYGQKYYFSNTCPICFEDQDLKPTGIKIKDWKIKKSNKCVACIPCGHIFHKECIYAWYPKRKTCPSCRAKIEKIESHIKINTKKET